MAYTYEQRTALRTIKRALAKELRRQQCADAEQELARLGVQLEEPTPPPAEELPDVLRTAERLLATTYIRGQPAGRRRQ